MKMRKITSFFLLLFAVGFVFMACDKDDFEYEDSFKKSYNTWLEFKKKSNNSYTYTIQNSTWIGYSWETSIAVVNGKVTQRSFKYTQGSDIPENKEWTENEAEIGTHKDSPAAEALTLDQIYEKAKQDWLQKRKDTETFFETKNNGMISTCGYVPNGCMDDCFRGINIKLIEVLAVYYPC